MRTELKKVQKLYNSLDFLTSNRSERRAFNKLTEVKLSTKDFIKVRRFYAAWVGTQMVDHIMIDP